MDRPGGGAVVNPADGPFERFLTSAIVTILTILFSWKILLERKSTESGTQDLNCARRDRGIENGSVLEPRSAKDYVNKTVRKGVETASDTMEEQGNDLASKDHKLTSSVLTPQFPEQLMDTQSTGPPKVQSYLMNSAVNKTKRSTDFLHLTALDDSLLSGFDDEDETDSGSVMSPLTLNSDNNRYLTSSPDLGPFAREGAVSRLGIRKENGTPSLDSSYNSSSYLFLSDQESNNTPDSSSTETSPRGKPSSVNEDLSIAEDKRLPIDCYGDISNVACVNKYREHFRDKVNDNKLPRPDNSEYLGSSLSDKPNHVSPGTANQLSRRHAGERTDIDRRAAAPQAMQTFNVRDFIPKRLHQKFLQTLVAKGGIAEGDLQETEFGYEVTTGRLTVDNDQLINTLEEFLMQEGCLDSSGSECSDDLFNRTLETITEENSDDVRSSDDDDIDDDFNEVERNDRDTVQAENCDENSINSDTEVQSPATNSLKRLHSDNPTLVKPYKFPKMQRRQGDDEVDVTSDCSSGDAGSMDVTFSDLEEFSGENPSQRYMPPYPLNTTIIGPYMDRSSQYARERVNWNATHEPQADKKGNDSKYCGNKPVADGQVENINALVVGNEDCDVGDKKSMDCDGTTDANVCTLTKKPAFDAAPDTHASIDDLSRDHLQAIQTGDGKQVNDKLRVTDVPSPVDQQMLCMGDNAYEIISHHLASGENSKAHDNTTQQLEEASFNNKRDINTTKTSILSNCGDGVTDSGFLKGKRPDANVTVTRENEHSRPECQITHDGIINVCQRKPVNSSANLLFTVDDSDSQQRKTSYLYYNSSENLLSPTPGVSNKGVIITSEALINDDGTDTHHHDNPDSASASQNDSIPSLPPRPTSIEDIQRAIESQVINNGQSPLDHKASCSTACVSDHNVTGGETGTHDVTEDITDGNARALNNQYPLPVPRDADSNDIPHPSCDHQKHVSSDSGMATTGINQLPGKATISDGDINSETCIRACALTTNTNQLPRVFNAEGNVDNLSSLPNNSQVVEIPANKIYAWDNGGNSQSGEKLGSLETLSLDRDISQGPNELAPVSCDSFMTRNMSRSPSENTMTFSELLTFQIPSPKETDGGFVFTLPPETIGVERDLDSPSGEVIPSVNPLESEIKPLEQILSTQDRASKKQPGYNATASRDYSALISNPYENADNYARGAVNSLKPSSYESQHTGVVAHGNKQPARDVHEYHRRRAEIPIVDVPPSVNDAAAMNYTEAQAVLNLGVDDGVNKVYNSHSKRPAHKNVNSSYTPHLSHGPTGKSQQSHSMNHGRDQEAKRQFDGIKLQVGLDGCSTEVAPYLNKNHDLEEMESEVMAVSLAREDTKSCRALATSTALARRDDEEEYPTSEALVSAVASAEAVGDNPYIAVARASARAATVATASAAQAVATSGKYNKQSQDNRDITVVISTSCVISDEDRDEVVKETQAVLQSAGHGVNVSVQTQPRAAIMDASTQSSPDQKRRNLKITIEQPDGQLQNKEVRTIQCQLPDVASLSEIESIIQTTVKKVIDNDSDADMDKIWARQLDETIHTVTEHAIGAFSERQPTFAMEKFRSYDSRPAQPASLVKEVLPLTDQNYTGTDKRGRTQHYMYVNDPDASRDSMYDHQPLIQVIDRPVSHSPESSYHTPLKTQKDNINTARGRSLSLHRVRTSSLSPVRENPREPRSRSYQPPPERHSSYVTRSHDVPSHLLNPVKGTDPSKPFIPPLGSFMDNSVNIPHRVPPTRPSGYQGSNLRERHDNNSFPQTQCLPASEEPYQTDEIVDNADIVKAVCAPSSKAAQPPLNLGKSSSEISAATPERKKKKKSKKHETENAPDQSKKKLKGILKKTAEVPYEKENENDMGSEEAPDIKQVHSSEIDVTLPAPHNGASAEGALRDQALHGSISPVDSSQSKLGASQVPQQNTPSNDYRSVLQQPVGTIKLPPADQWKYDLPTKATPESRRKINSHRKDFLGIGTQSENLSTSGVISTANEGALGRSAPQQIKPFIVDIDLEDTHQVSKSKTNSEELKQKIVNARLRPPPSSYVDSVWNARELIAAKSQELGLNLNADGRLERAHGLPFEPVDYLSNDPSNAALVRRSKSLSSVDPGRFFEERKLHTSLYETDLDTGEVRETPLVYETNIDEYPEKTKSLTNLDGGRYNSVCDNNNDGLDKHRSVGDLLNHSSAGYDTQNTLNANSKDDDTHKSQSELRFCRSLNRLSIPDSYRSSIREKKEVVSLPNTKSSTLPKSLTSNEAESKSRNPRPVVIQHRVSQPAHFTPTSTSNQSTPVDHKAPPSDIYELPSAKLRQKQSDSPYQQVPVKPYRPLTAVSENKTGISAKEAYLRLRDKSQERSKPVLDNSISTTVPGDDSRSKARHSTESQPSRAGERDSDPHSTSQIQSQLARDGPLSYVEATAQNSDPPLQKDKDIGAKKKKSGKKSKKLSKGSNDSPGEKTKKRKSKAKSPYNTEENADVSKYICDISTDSTTTTTTTATGGEDETGPLCTSTPNIMSPMDPYKSILHENPAKHKHASPTTIINQQIPESRFRSMYPSASDSIADSARGSSLIGSSTPSGSPNTVESQVSGVPTYNRLPVINDKRYDSNTDAVKEIPKHGQENDSSHISSYYMNLSGQSGSDAARVRTITSVGKDHSRGTLAEHQADTSVGQEFVRDTYSAPRRYTYLTGTPQAAFNESNTSSVPERMRQYPGSSDEYKYRNKSADSEVLPDRVSHLHSQNLSSDITTQRRPQSDVQLRQYDESPTFRRRRPRSDNISNPALNDSLRSKATHSSLEEVLDGLLALPPQSKSMIHPDRNPNLNETPVERAFRLLRQVQSPHDSNIDTEIKAGNLGVKGAGDASPERYATPAFIDFPDASDDDKAVAVKCRNKKCRAKADLAEARKSYKTCHNCYTYYCSRECRKEHWERHKKKCLYSRANSLCKHVIKSVHDDVEISSELTRIVRTGYLSKGRGCVLFVFSSPEEADSFVKNGWSSLAAPPIFVTVQDIENTDLFGEQHLELVDMCRSYNPEIKYVIEVVIIAGSIVQTHPSPRREGPAIKKCMKLRLSNVRTPRQTPQPKNESDTLILTAVPGAEFTENMAGKKAREVCFIHIQRQLRQRGVSLRHNFPDIYKKLCAYVAENVHFPPITIFPVDRKTGKRFMCLIMPSSDPDIEWMDKPDLLEELGLDTSV